MAKFQGTGKVELMQEAHNNNSEFDLITLRRQVKALPFTQASSGKAEPQAIRLLPVCLSPARALLPQRLTSAL